MNHIGLALQIPAIGAAQMAGNVLTGKGSGLRGLIKDIRFGEMLSNKLENATGGTDAASQLAALMQGGIPVATIANNIATSLTNGIARAMNGSMSKDMQQQLQRALASALAPPGSDQSAQALVQRLRSAIETMTREVKTDAGQQSRFSGDVLDAAKTAKEIPAQQLLRDAIAALGSGAASSVSTPANPPQKQAVYNGPVAATPAPPQMHAPSHAADIIGRMIVRAMGVDAQRQTTPPVPSTNVTGTPNTNVTSSSVLFTRLVALIEQNAARNDGGTHTGDDKSQSQAQAAQLPATDRTDSASNAFAAPAFSLNPSHVASSTAAPAAAAYAPIDAQAVIDQIVKGFAVHTSGSTSEVRMRLHPEQLGDVSLKLSVSGGTVNASIVAQNADVRQTLLANQHQLAASLADAGLKLGAFSVDVSGGNPDGRTAQQFQQFGKKTFSRAFSGDVEATDTVEPKFGPSILNRPADPWLLNYFA